MFTHILLPLDGSGLAERALPYAARLSRGGRLSLVRAVPAMRWSGRSAPETQSTIVRQAEAELAAIAARRPGIDCSIDCHVSCDDAAATILDAARRLQTDLIVMSTHGRSGLGRLVHGSVADRVLHQADRPILMIPASCQRDWPPAGTPGLARILVPLDGSALAETALGPARDLATQLGAGLLLVRVVEPPNYAYPDGANFPLSDSTDELATARTYLQRTAAGFVDTGISVSWDVVEGFACGAIQAFARSTEVVAVALATHGRGGVPRLVLGSTATGLMQHSDVPLLLLRPGSRDPGPTRNN